MQIEVSFKSWKCDVTCKIFCSEEKQAITDLTNVLTEESVKDARAPLQNLDSGCEHGHYSKPYNNDLHSEESSSVDQFKELKGHPLQCAHDFRSSRLCLVRANTVHYSALRPLLNNLYCKRRSDNGIRRIESVYIHSWKILDCRILHSC